MKALEYIISNDRDEIAVYLDGIFEETILHLTVDDFQLYSEGDQIQVRVQEATDALEDYLRVHEEWPTRWKYVRDIMDS